MKAASLHLLKGREQCLTCPKMTSLMHSTTTCKYEIAMKPALQGNGILGNVSHYRMSEHWARKVSDASWRQLEGNPMKQWNDFDADGVEAVQVLSRLLLQFYGMIT